MGWLAYLGLRPMLFVLNWVENDGPLPFQPMETIAGSTCAKLLETMAAAAASSRARFLLGFRRRAPLPLPPLPLPSPVARAATRRRGVRMASSASAPPSTTIEVPGAAGPVIVVGAPGLPEADFRSVPSPIPSAGWVNIEGVL